METHELTPHQKQQYDLFHSDLLNNLNFNHYELHDIYPDFSPAEWRDFLSENSQEIMKEISYLTEAASRKALARLNSNDRSQKLSSADISAIKALLDKSEQLNAMTQNQNTFITTFLPNPDDKFRLLTEQEDPMELMAHLMAILTERFYQEFQPDFAPNDRRDISRNGNGTLRFNHKDSVTDIDKKYMAIFNPYNENRGKGEWLL